MQVLHGQLVMSQLLGQHADAVPGIGLAWVGLQYLPVQLLGLGVLAFVVMLKRHVQNVGDRRHVLLILILGSSSDSYGLIRAELFFDFGRIRRIDEFLVEGLGRSLFPPTRQRRPACVR